MENRHKFAILRGCRRIWAVGSIHADAARLDRLHHALTRRLAFGDRLVYLGNLIGRGGDTLATLDSLLRFRSLFMARPDAFACDVVFLRGSQEEMWQKLLQLQFATDPKGVLQWMLDQGVAASLEAYGIDPREGLREAAAGPRQLTRWTSSLRQTIKNHPGHYELLGILRRAAYSDRSGAEAAPTPGGLLFVNASLDPSRPLEAQKDSFWWGGAAFGDLPAPYGGFARVVRGASPDRPGLALGRHTATVDAGCGHGGSLLAVCFGLDGSVADQVEA